MNRIEDILEAELVHLRTMLARMQSGEVTMRSREDEDMTPEITEEHRLREADLAAALERHRRRNA